MRKLGKGFVVLFGLVALLVPGCGSSFGDYCKAKQQCIGGNDKDIAACEDEAQGWLEVANDYGCGDAANQLVDCVNAKYSCSTGESACNPEAEAVSACENVASAWRNKHKDNSGTCGNCDGGKNTACCAAGLGCC